MKALSILLTTLSAAAIGYAAGTLLAPHKGSKTRSKIYKSSHKYADHLADSYEDFVDKISQSLENLETETKRITKKGKAEVKKVAADLNAKMH